mgnify:CR=1 FL=1
MNSLSVIKPHACHLCDRNFAKKYNLQRHLETIHAEEHSVDSVDSDKMDYNPQYEPFYKKRRVEETHDHDDEESSEEDDNSEREAEDNEESEREEEEEEGPSSDLEDNPAYQDWLEEAKETTADMWNVKYQKYIDEGMSDDQAKEKANTKTLWAVKRNFFASFKEFLLIYLHLKDDDTYQEIIWDLEEKIEKGMDINKALNRIIPRYKSKFAGLFTQEVESEDGEEESDEDEEL